MSKAKARRVDYYPDEYIAGVGGVLTAAQHGVYWIVCTLIMSEGGAIAQDDRRIGGLCRMRPADVRKTIEGLIELGKILRKDDGRLSQKRAQSEVEKSLNRIQIASENGSNGGRPAGKAQSKQQFSKPNGYADDKTNLQLPTSNHQPSTKEKKELSLENEREFEAFYQAYPRHVGKGAARTAYVAARRKIGADELVVAAGRFAVEVTGKDPKFTPHPSTWLNAERWADDKADAGSAPSQNERSRREAEIYASLR